MASAGSFKDAGNAAFKQGDHAAALVAYTRSIELDPSEFALYLNRSITFLKLKRYVPLGSSSIVLQATDRKVRHGSHTDGKKQRRTHPLRCA